MFSRISVVVLLVLIFAPVARIARAEGLGAAEAEMRGRADSVLAACSPALRARHEGMILYLLDIISRARPGDDKSRSEMSRRITELSDLLNALKSGQDVLSSKRGRFEWAYKSDADGSGQPIMINLPLDYNPLTPLPLVLTLHGSGGSHAFGASPAGAPSYIALGIDLRGDSDCEGLGELDMVEAAQFMLGNFSIDPSRVMLIGHSMGAGGVLRALTHYPDLFSGGVVVSGWATALDMDNLIGLPVQVHHGDQDWVVPLDFMRLACGDIAGCRSLDFVEYPGAGHGIYGSVNRNSPLTILYDMPAPRLPRKIQYSTDQVTRGHRAWIDILRLIDPHGEGSINIGAGRTGIHGETRNICVLRLSHLDELFPSAKKVEIDLDDSRIALNDVPSDVTLLRTLSGWSVIDNAGRWTNPPVYQRRGWFNIYDGQPIRIVAPRKWRDDADTKALVDKCSTLSCPGAPAMPYGHIEVVGEDSPLPKCHVILIGSPEDNRQVADVLKHLPVRLTPNSIIISGVGRFPRRSTAVCLNYYNPASPSSRIIWLLNATRDTLPPDLPLPDGDGYTPDILVWDRSGKAPVLLAAADFGDNWSSPISEGCPRPVRELARSLALACGRGSGADFVLYQDLDQGRDTWFGAKSLSMSSLIALLPPGLQPLCRARLNPAQLDDLRSHLKGQQKLLSVGHPRAKQLYDVIFDESIIWRLGCDLHYNFPRGSLAHTGADVSDFLPALR